MAVSLRIAALACLGLALVASASPPAKRLAAKKAVGPAANVAAPFALPLGDSGSDSCDGAGTLDIGQTPFTNAGATDEGDGSPCSFFGSDIWYRFTAPCDTEVTISVCGSNFDTVLAVYADCMCPPDPGAVVACNDDFDCNGDGLIDLQSQVTFSGEQDTCYLVRLGGFLGAQGSGTIQVTVDLGAPDNDDCVDAAAAAAGSTPFTSCLATTNFDDPDCVILADVWFDYEVSAGGPYDLELSADGSAPFDVAVYAGNGCPPGERLGCGQSVSLENVESGTLFKVRVGNVEGLFGEGDLTIVEGDPFGDPCDDCATACTLNEGEPVSGNFADAGASGTQGGCDGDDQNPDLWYTLTAPGDGTASASLCTLSGTLTLYDGCDGTEIACSISDCSTKLGGPASINWGVSEGETYILRVADSGDGLASYELEWTFTPPPAECDTCAEACLLEAGFFAGTTANNNAAASAASCDAGADPVDAWFRYDASETGAATVTVLSTFATTVAVYDACDGNELTCVVGSCVDTDCSASAEFDVTSGDSRWIRVAGQDGATGDFTVEVTVDTTMPECDTCATACELLEGSFTGTTTDNTASGVLSACGDDLDTIDEWVQFSVTANGTATVSLQSDFQATLSAYLECGAGSDLCAVTICAEGKTGPFCVAELMLSVEAGDTWRLRIAGTGGGTGGYQVDVSIEADIPCDTCEVACDLVDTANGSIDGNTASGTTTSCAKGEDPKDAWYRWTATETATAIFTLDSGFQSTLAVYDACGEAELDCVAAMCPVALGPPCTAELSWDVIQDQAYLIRIGAAADATGAYTLGVDFQMPPCNTCETACGEDGGYSGSTADNTPSGVVSGCRAAGSGLCDADSCAEADAISGVGLFDFDNSAATADGVEDPLCDAFGSQQIDNDVWCCWTAACDGQVTVETCGLTGVDTKIAVYDGCTPCPTGGGILACNDDTCGLQSQVTFSATAGSQYLIRIGTFPGVSGGTGQFSISSDGCLGDTIDEWRSWTASGTGGATVAACVSGPATISVYDACGGTELACVSGESDLVPLLATWDATTDAEYRIRIAGNDESTVDYELQFVEFACGDTNGDGLVNVDDLNAVIANWCPPPPKGGEAGGDCDPDADVANPSGACSSDGWVDVNDLNAVIAGWTGNPLCN